MDIKTKFDLELTAVKRMLDLLTQDIDTLSLNFQFGDMEPQASDIGTLNDVRGDIQNALQRINRI